MAIVALLSLVAPGIEDVLTTAPNSLAPAEVCARIKQFGYSTSQQIRIYGEEFEVLSDPFPSDGGIGIQVRSKRTSQMRTLQLPNTVVQRVRTQLIPVA